MRAAATGGHQQPTANSLLLLWAVATCLLLAITSVTLRDFANSRCRPNSRGIGFVPVEIPASGEAEGTEDWQATDRPQPWWQLVQRQLMVDNREGNGSLNLARPKIGDASEWGQGRRVLELLNYKEEVRRHQILQSSGVRAVLRRWREVRTDRAILLHPPSQFLNMFYNFSLHKCMCAFNDLFNLQRNGTYVEVGAYDGEFFSNSLILEVKYGWTGVLIETVPRYFEKLLTKNRRACMVNACVSDKPWHKQATSRVNQEGDQYDEVSSALEGYLPVLGQGEITEVRVPCFPLFDILYACGVAGSVDVLFLDIQGAEMDVIKTIPWHFVDIKVLVVEVSSLLRIHGADVPVRVLRETKTFLEIWGYELSGNVKMDYIFTRRNMRKQPK